MLIIPPFLEFVSGCPPANTSVCVYSQKLLPTSFGVQLPNCPSCSVLAILPRLDVLLHTWPVSILQLISGTGSPRFRVPRPGKEQVPYSIETPFPAARFTPFEDLPLIRSRTTSLQPLPSWCSFRSPSRLCSAHELGGSHHCCQLCFAPILPWAPFPSKASRTPT